MCSRKLKDETGARYGRLVVDGRAADPRPGARWLCKCDCGATSTVHGQLLRRGKVKSCGCLNTELRVERAKSVRLQPLEKQASKVAARRKWQCSHPDQIRKNQSGGSSSLADWYVRQVFARICACPASDISDSLVEAKREHLRLVRLLRRETNEIAR